MGETVDSRNDEHPEVRPIPIRDINIGDRVRRVLGDITGLAENIREHGLFHPIVLDKDYNLVAGLRRIRAYEQLGRDKIPARIIDIKAIAEGEYSENLFRQDFTSSEIIDIIAKVQASRLGHRISAEGKGKGPKEHPFPSLRFQRARRRTSLHRSPGGPLLQSQRCRK